jgi:hypothetical protein
MAGPWERFRPPASGARLAGPWEKFAPPEKGAQSALGQVSVGQDIANTIPSALGRGVFTIPGAGGDIQELALRGYDWLRGAEQMTPEQMDERTFFPTSRKLARGYENATGTKFYEPKTGPGKVVGAALEAVPSAATMGPGVVKAAAKGGASLLDQLASNATKYGALPMAASETAGQATEGTPWESYARVGGAVAGLTGPSVAGRLITPMPMAPSRQAAVRTLEKEGVTNLTAGQKTGNRKLQYVESEVGGQKIDDMLESQREQFTTAALNRAGIQGTRATPETMRRAYQDMGAEFDRLATNNTAMADQQFTNDIVQVANDFAAIGPAQERVAALRRFMNDIGLVMSPSGEISGRAYKALRSRIERAARETSDPEFAIALRGVRDALDDAMERTMVAAGSPDVGAWQAVRKKYRDFLVVERAAAAPGAEEGLLTPAQLRAAESGVHGKREYVLGRGAFGDLARAGQTVMKPLPQSGTAPRLAARQIPTILGAIAGGTTTGGDVASTVAGAALGGAVPNIMGKLLLSRLGRKYLSNQAVTPPRVAGQGAAVTGLNVSRSANTPPSGIMRDRNGVPVLDSRGQYLILP